MDDVKETTIPLQTKEAAIALMSCQEELANLTRMALAYPDIFPDNSDRSMITTIQNRLSSIAASKPIHG